MTFAGGEPVLTRWMDENTSVSWVVHPEPWLLEKELMATLDVPLVVRVIFIKAFHTELYRILL